MFDTIYTYDSKGRLDKTIALKLNGVVYATYSGLNSNGVATFSDNLDNATTALVTSNTYTAIGALDKVTKANGIVEDYDYDGLGHLTDVTAEKDSTTLFSQQFVLELDGQRSSALEKRNGLPDVFIDWSYDDQNHLIGETRDEGNDGQTGAGDYITTYGLCCDPRQVRRLFGSATTVQWVDHARCGPRSRHGG